MAWFKVDDGLHSSRKVLSIPRNIRLQAIGLWALAGSWVAKELTDGHVPDFVVSELGGTQKLVDALVKAGLWKEVPDGHDFHDWLGYQPSRAQVMEIREKDAERKREARGRGAESRRSPGGQKAESNVESDLPVQSRPIPSDPGLTDQDIYLSSYVSSAPSYPQTTNDQPDVELGKVRAAVQRHCGRECTDPQAWLVIGAVMQRAKQTPKNKTAFVLKAIESDPIEFQQIIDEAVAA